MPQPHRSPRSRPPRPRTPELVLIPGGNPDALPIKVAPMPDEWSVSWIRRMAERYEVSPNTFFNQLGYRRKIHSVHAIAGRLNINAHDLADHFLLTEQERRQLAAVPPLSSATRTYARYYDTPYGAARSARYCPLCLADETAYWRAAWTQPLMLCCPKHHVALLNTCPGCHQLLMTNRTWATAPTPLWQCTERLPGRPGSGKHRPRCEHDLRTATTTPVCPASSSWQDFGFGKGGDGTAPSLVDRFLGAGQAACVTV